MEFNPGVYKVMHFLRLNGDWTYIVNGMGHQVMLTLAPRVLVSTTGGVSNEGPQETVKGGKVKGQSFKPEAHKNVLLQRAVHIGWVVGVTYRGDIAFLKAQGNEGNGATGAEEIYPGQTSHDHPEW